MSAEHLAAVVAEARSRRGVSAAQVAAHASISESYVRKLEQGAVNDPSPRVLRRLASAIGVPYRALMDAAGYLHGLDAGDSDHIERVDLSDDERRALDAFIDFLVSRRHRG